MAGESRRTLVLRWLPPLLWMAVIFGFSSLTGSELQTVSAWSTYGHLGEYAVLGAMLAIAALQTWPKLSAALFGVAVASAYGVTDELHQFLTPGRTPDPHDWAADTLGATVAVVCVVLVEWLLRRRRGLSGD